VDLVHVEPGLTAAGAVFGSREKLVEIGGLKETACRY